MELKIVVIEYRPRLQSCYVFVSFNKSVSEENIKLEVLQKSIIIKYIEERDNDVDEKFKNINLNTDLNGANKSKHIIFDTSEFFSLDNTSISGLVYSGSEIIFRLQTEPNDTNSGSFKTELFTNINDTYKKTDKYTINVSALTPYAFVCRQCSNKIFSTKGFKRVLELPSENLDMSDWFCHKHESDDCKKTNKPVLQPDLDELFYKDYFSIINPKLISDAKPEKDIKCNKCESIIGDVVKNGLKIFNSSIELRNITTTKLLSMFSYKNSAHEIAVQDFLNITRQHFQNTNQCFLLPQICKIIYETQTSQNEKKYLLLWILDKHLPILRNKEDSFLKLIHTTKLLFRVENNDGDVYKKWNNEIEKNNITVEDIPHQIFEAGCRQLQLLAECVSEKYRNVDEFTMTYLDL